MQGYFSLLLHAHLPYVRHPEHPRFLEENWLFEAITECYIPLIEKMEGWAADGMDVPFTLTLTPTVCTMLLDPLLQSRYKTYLEGLIELAEKETHRTYWDKSLQPLAIFYLERFQKIRGIWDRHNGNLLAAFRQFQDGNKLEIITCAATHALLPLMEAYPESIRAQILVARDHYRSCFGRDPKGIWLPECAYVAGVENVLQEANIRWLVSETHGVLSHVHSRDTEHSLRSTRRMAWRYSGGILIQQSKSGAGTKDIQARLNIVIFIGISRSMWIWITSSRTCRRRHNEVSPGLNIIKSREGPAKRKSTRTVALHKCAEHAGHFLQSRIHQIQMAAKAMEDRPPHLLAPYDAELFGHWWFEGPELLDYFMRKTFYDQDVVKLITPTAYLEEHQTHQVARPSSSSWGEEGYWKVWLNETNDWIYPHLNVAQERMTELARQFPQPDFLHERALKQQDRELLLAQASDWPFILKTGTSPEYAKKRVKEHLLRFIALHDQLTSTSIDEAWLSNVEQIDNIFPDINYHYWT